MNIDYGIGDLVWVDLGSFSSEDNHEQLGLVIRFKGTKNWATMAVVLLLDGLPSSSPHEVLVPLKRIRLAPSSKEITDEDR
mgnify:FL=1